MAVAAGGVHAQVIAAGDHAVAGAKGRVCAFDDFAHGVNAGGVGIVTGHAAVAVGGEGIFVVERGIADADEQIAGGQVVHGARLDLAHDAGVGDVYNEGLEGCLNHGCIIRESAANANADGGACCMIQLARRRRGGSA